MHRITGCQARDKATAPPQQPFKGMGPHMSNITLCVCLLPCAVTQCCSKSVSMSCSCVTHKSQPPQGHAATCHALNRQCSSIHLLHYAPRSKKHVAQDTRATPSAEVPELCHANIPTLRCATCCARCWPRPYSALHKPDSVRFLSHY
jgi:hypothetical protein